MNGLSSSLGNPTPADALLHLLQCESARSVDAYAVRSRATNVTRLDVHCGREVAASVPTPAPGWLTRATSVRWDRC